MSGVDTVFGTFFNEKSLFYTCQGLLERDSVVAYEKSHDYEVLVEVFQLLRS